MSCNESVKGLGKQKHKPEEQKAKKSNKKVKVSTSEAGDKVPGPAVLSLYEQEGTLGDTYI